MPAAEITLIHTDSPAIVQDDRTVALPIQSWLSDGFWNLFGLPSADRVLGALTFGTEWEPRTYFARHIDYPATWTSEPLTVSVPAITGAGPGVLEVSGPMNWERRRMVERTSLVITLAAPSEYGPAPTSEQYRWHTTVLVAGVHPGEHTPLRYSESW